MAEYAGPVRKRRRPALSCAECRRRKVKCDRNRPCGQCTQGGRPGCSLGHANNASQQPSTLLDALSSGLQPYQSSQQPAFEAGSPLNDSLHAVAVPHAPVSAASQQGLMGSITGSPNSEGDGDEIPSHLPYRYANHFPTPGASPGIHSRNQRGPGWRAGASLDNLAQVNGASSLNASAPQASSTGQTIHGLKHRKQNAEEVIPCPPTNILGGEASAHSSGCKLRGTLSKTRLFGPSHWMGYFDQFEKIHKFSHGSDLKDSGFPTLEILDLLKKCKELARLAKAQQKPQALLGPILDSSIPPRAISDQLIQLYFRTFESAFRILHIPSFQKEYARYYGDSNSANTGFVIQMLLVMSIGACLFQDDNENELRSTARQWIHAAQLWLSAPSEKSRLNIAGLQVHCLLLLARQVNSVESDLVWISAGSLLRTAMQMGLHRDPQYLPRMSILHAELRRRLWATVVELAVQSSLDSGLPSLISSDDFDTEPPANIDDDEIDETTKVVPAAKAISVYTQTSFQLTLLQSLRTRHEICRVINDFRFEPSYEVVLQLDKEMTAAWRSHGLLMQAYQSGIPGKLSPPTTFHRNVVGHMLRSFLLALHRPTSAKARKDPRFYFSRKRCLDTALALLSPEPSEDFSRLIVVAGGMFRALLVHGGCLIGLELIAQLEEDAENMALSRNKANRDSLCQTIKNLAKFSEKRIELGETNVRGHMFYYMLIGQIEAMEAGTSQERGIYEGAKKSVEISYRILQARVTPASTPASNPSPAIPMSRGPQRQSQVSGEDSSDLSKEDDGQDLGFDFLQDGTLDSFCIPDSWLFTDWNAIGEEC